MALLKVEAETRIAGSPRADRRKGWIPAILYGGSSASTPIRLRKSDVLRILERHGGRGLLELQVDGQRETVMMKDVQREPVKDEVIHLDFFRVTMSEKLQTTVPIFLIGEEEATSGGGIVQLQLRELEIQCLPADLPDRIEADISGIRPGTALTVSDLKPPAGVDILNDPDQVVASVVLPRAVREADTAAEDEGEGGEAAADAGTGEADAGES